jgi:hypothetical protein
MDHFLRRSLITCTLALTALSIPGTADAFGVSPPYVRAPVLRRGSEFSSTIFLVQASPASDLRVRAEFDVPEKIKSWLSVDGGEEFVIPAGFQQYPLKVFVRVPQDADHGVYNGYLRVNTVPVRSAGEQIAISVGARIDLSLTVGDNVVQEFSIRKMDILDIRQGENPQVVVTLDNTGNVPIAPDRASFELFDKFGQIRLGYAALEKFPETEPFQSRDFVMEFPVDVRLALGEYWGEVRLYRGTEVIKELRTVFNVVERKVDYVLYGSLLAVVVVLGITFLIVSRIRRIYLHAGARATHDA